MDAVWSPVVSGPFQRRAALYLLGIGACALRYDAALQQPEPGESALNVDDCYRELGVAPGSSDAEVKAAWRRLAARWHPDRNASPEALRKIQRINHALEAIRRSKDADLVQHEAPEPEPESAPHATVEHTVHLTLEEVANGCVRELRGEVTESCADCEGSGLQRHATRCGDCAGTGRVRQPFWLAWVAGTVECGACAGHGTRRAGCSACAGSGKAAPRKYRCRVQVPPGLRTGNVLDVAARVQGRHRHHQLMLRVRAEVAAHEFFSHAADGTVSCELPVDGFAWIANRWVEVPTPRGLRQMRLQRGTLNYRIKGEGLPWLEAGGPADCIVTVVPMFPEEFSAEQEAGIDRLVASNSGAARTAAGKRMGAWKRLLASWQERLKERARE
jgi:DnaJ-class molecular chaperone